MSTRLTLATGCFLTLLTPAQGVFMARPRKHWAPKAISTLRPIKRVVGYVRVSTGDQATEGFGLDAQRDAILKYTDAAGYELVGMLGDEGLSGTLGPDERPGLATVLEWVKSGAVDGVVVKALDRIGRRPAVATAVFDTLDEAGVTFLSITEPALSSDLLRGLFAGIASDERRRILERTSSGRQAKANRGGYAGGRVPYGYRLVGARRDARWEIVPDQAAVVRRIFELRLAKATYAAIATTLTTDGVPAPRGGTVWSTSAIFQIVNNLAYTGARRWRESHEIVAPGEHQPIVDQATFERCQLPNQAA
jgi:site-specific DNA recombinase